MQKIPKVYPNSPAKSILPLGGAIPVVDSKIKTFVLRVEHELTVNAVTPVTNGDHRQILVQHKIDQRADKQADQPGERRQDAPTAAMSSVPTFRLKSFWV